MSGFVDFLADMPLWYWLIFAAALLALELATGSTHLLWPAGAAAVVGVALPLAGSWHLQVAAFAGLTAALSLVGPRTVTPWLRRARADHHDLNEGGLQKVGRRGEIAERFSAGMGRVRLGDTVWAAEAADGAALDGAEPGTPVEIVDTRGATLIIRPMQPTGKS